MLSVMFIFPVLLIEMFAGADWSILLTVKVGVVFTRLIAPPVPVLKALKLATLLAPFRVTPPEELVFSAKAEIKPPPLWLIVPPVAVKLAPLWPLIAPVMFMFPVLIIERAEPAPHWQMMLVVKGTVLLKFMLPPSPVVVALKLPTALAPFRVCAPLELVVREAAVMPVLMSWVMEPPEVRLTVPIPTFILPMS
jgi:hypothetical protein